MKFQCDRCKTRYSISDEKIRGKILKIRCKNCSSVITVREGMDLAPDSPSPAAAPAPAGPAVVRRPTAGGSASSSTPATPALEAAFNRAMSRLPTPAPLKGGLNLGGEDEAPDEDDADRTRISSGPPSIEPIEIEWFVSIEGNQEGPFTLAEAQRRVGKKQPQEEMFAWCDGFDDWLPVEKVPELAPSIPKPPPAKRRSSARPVAAPPPPTPEETPAPSTLEEPPRAPRLDTPPPLPAPPRPGPTPLPGPLPVPMAAAAAVEAPEELESPDEAPFSLAALAASAPGVHKETPAEDGAVASGGDSFEFEIGEASRVVRLPIPLPSGAGAASPAARAGLPGLGGRNGASTAALGARGSGAADAVPVPVLGSDVNASASVLAPVVVRRQGRTGLILALSGAAVAGILVVLLVVLLRDRGGNETASTEGSGALAGESLDGVGTRFLTVPGSGQPAQPGEDPATKGTTVRPKVPGTKPPIRTGPATNPGTGPSTSTNPQSTGPGLTPGSAGPSTTTDTGPMKPLTADEVYAVYARNSAGLRWCYERALKINPDLKPGRIDVTITINPAGQISKIDVKGSEADLNSCIKQKIGTWGFRRSTADFTIRFPVVFQS